MYASDAARFLNNEIILKPGWRIQATPYDRFGTVVIEAEVITNNFDRENAPDYSDLIRAGGSFEISTEGSKAEVLKRLIGEFVKIEEHEWREAARIKPSRPYGDYVAPFHPHRPEGQALWSNVTV